VAAVKLLLMPVVVWAAAALIFDTRGEAQVAAVVEGAVPAMMTTLILAGRFHLDEEAAALAIGWTTLLYWVTLPLLVALGLFNMTGAG
jgi:predicted permease